MAIPARTTRAAATMRISMRLNPLSSPTVGALLRHRCKPVLLSLLQDLTPWDIFLELVNNLSGILGLQVIRIYGRLHTCLGQLRLEGLRGQMSAQVCESLEPIGEGGPDHDCPEVRDIPYRLPDRLRRARISQVKQGPEIALDEIANADHRMGQANRGDPEMAEGGRPPLGERAKIEDGHLFIRELGEVGPQVVIQERVLQGAER